MHISFKQISIFSFIVFSNLILHSAADDNQNNELIRQQEKSRCAMIQCIDSSYKANLQNLNEREEFPTQVIDELFAKQAWNTDMLPVTRTALKCCTKAIVCQEPFEYCALCCIATPILGSVACTPVVTTLFPAYCTGQITPYCYTGGASICAEFSSVLFFQRVLLPALRNIYGSGFPQELIKQLSSSASWQTRLEKSKEGPQSIDMDAMDETLEDKYKTE